MIQVDKSGRHIFVPENMGFPITANMRIRLDIYNLLAGTKLLARGMYRVLHHNGTWNYVPFQFPIITPTSLGAVYQVFQALADGELISFSVTAASGTAGLQPGDCFVRAWIVYGGSGSTPTPASDSTPVPIVAALFADYVTTLGYVSYPGSPIRTDLTEKGSFLTIQGSAVGPDSDLAQFVESNQLWRVHKIAIQLTVFAGTVATTFFLLDENSLELQQWQTDALAGTQKIRFSHSGFIGGVSGAPPNQSGIVASPGQGTNGDLTVFTLGGPMYWRAGYTFTSSINFPPFQISDVVYQIERWVIPDSVTP